MWRSKEEWRRRGLCNHGETELERYAHTPEHERDETSALRIERFLCVFFLEMGI